MNEEHIITCPWCECERALTKMEMMKIEADKCCGMLCEECEHEYTVCYIDGHFVVTSKL